MSDPAIAVVEVDSIAVGILTGDAMVKASPLGSIYTGTVHPGRYVIVVSGDTASVEVAVDTGSSVAGDTLVDLVFLPDVHPLVVDAITRRARAMNVSIVVANCANVAGLGEGGEGFTSFSIATPTGEGLTRPRTFSRIRRVTVVGALRIV